MPLEMYERGLKLFGAPQPLTCIDGSKRSHRYGTRGIDRDGVSMLVVVHLQVSRNAQPFSIAGILWENRNSNTRYNWNLPVS